MSKEREALVEVLADLKYPGSMVKAAKVLSVDEDNRTCEVEFIENEVVQSDIRLKASEDGETDGFFLIPAVGSVVLVQLLDEEWNGFICSVNQVEKVLYLEGETVISFTKDLVSLISGGKLEFKNAGVNQKEILVGLIDIVAQIVVLQGKGPDIPGLADLKVKVNQLME